MHQVNPPLVGLYAQIQHVYHFRTNEVPDVGIIR